jgi:hypothetical protein
LFGIFKVNLPPLYGEGGIKAFLRLQEEIIKTSTDLSILAWSATDYKPLTRPGMFSVSPANFFFSRIKVDEQIDVEAYSMTNRGLCVKLPLIMSATEQECIIVLPNCRHTHGSRPYVDTPLSGFNQYHGAAKWSLAMRSRLTMSAK